MKVNTTSGGISPSRSVSVRRDLGFARIFFCTYDLDTRKERIPFMHQFFDGLKMPGDSILRSVSVADGRAVVSVSGKAADSGLVFLPGFADVHVHLREPGFSYKETVYTGTCAAARGGFTAVCAMPNLNPVPDSLSNLAVELDALNSGAVIDAFAFGAITVGEMGKKLADLETMAPFVAGYSDDGKGVMDASLMKEAMLRAKALGKIIAAHCEDIELVAGGAINDCAYAREHGIPGISNASEWKQIERDLFLAKETGVKYHVCHVSTKESVQLVRDAKKDGVDVTCETGPHYLVLDDGMLQDDGRFKMNPPLRSRADREAMVEALVDGTVDMIATDHAPHSAEEKSRGIAKSLNGVVGLETAFPVLYTELVRKDIISLEKLVHIMAYAPRLRFGIPLMDDDFTIFDLNTAYTVDPAEFVSMGKSSPFTGREVYGRGILTVNGGSVKWQENLTAH